jgi:hypothetical protein
VLSLSCFAGLLLVSDSHVYPIGANNVGECWRSVQLVQVVSYGQGHHCCTIYLYFFSAAI